MSRSVIGHTRAAKYEAGVLLLHDTFTDEDGTLLENHVVDTVNKVGAVWERANIEPRAIYNNQASGADIITKENDYKIDVFNGAVRVQVDLQSTDVSNINYYTFYTRFLSKQDYVGIRITQFSGFIHGIEFIYSIGGNTQPPIAVHIDTDLIGTLHTLDITDDGLNISLVLNGGVTLSGVDNTDIGHLSDMVGTLGVKNTAESSSIMDNLKVWTATDTLNYTP